MHYHAPDPIYTEKRTITNPITSTNPQPQNMGVTPYLVGIFGESPHSQKRPKYIVPNLNILKSSEREGY